MLFHTEAESQLCCLQKDYVEKPDGSKARNPLDISSLMKVNHKWVRDPVTMDTAFTKGDIILPFEATNSSEPVASFQEIYRNFQFDLPRTTPRSEP